MRFAVLLSLLSLALCENMDEKWHSWKSAHGKFYVDSNEESERRLIWTENYGLITQHNNANRSFSLGLNEFADMTQDEFQQLYLAQARSPADVSTSGIRHVPLRDAVYGDSIDWREKGYVTAVKNQGQCGSCWAFSATGALEGQMYRTKGSLTSLSEQQLVDCSWKYGNSGCNGGLMDYAFVYVKNSGLCSRSSYPYLGYTWRCKSSSCSSVASCSGYKDISSGSESDLLDAVSRMGPVSVAIDASSYQFQFYSSGVYTDSSCSSSRLNHGVLVVGYGTTNNKNYWIVKNSWGTSWGSSGYINMYRGSNMCGIASAASYPTV